MGKTDKDDVELFHKHQVDGAEDEEECQKMVPVEVLMLEHDIGYDGKDGQRYTLLDDLELYQIEGAAIAFETHPVGRNLTAVFKEGDAPREGNDAEQGPV